MTDSNAPSLADQFSVSISSLSNSMYEINSLADFFLSNSLASLELVQLWFEAFRARKSIRSPLIYGANEVIIRAAQMTEENAAWGFIEHFGGVLEDLTHFLGSDKDYVSLKCFVKVIHIWEKLNMKVFLSDYLKMVTDIAEVRSRQSYMQDIINETQVCHRVEEFEITRKLKELSHELHMFELLKEACDGKKAGTDMNWMYFVCQDRGVKLASAMTASLFMLTVRVTEESSRLQSSSK